MRALVTGGTGFVGRQLVAELRNRGHAVRVAVRSASDERDTIAIGDLANPVDWTAALAGIDTVFHLAARVHDSRDDAAARAAFHAVNVAASAALAKAAARAGVQRFVFASSVKAAGERSDKPLQEHDAPQPQDAYGKSKLAAEQALRQVTLDTGTRMAIAAIRPPLVYGPGVRANFHALLRLATSPWPLPLAGATAPRSLVYVGNLVDALIAAAERGNGGCETYFVSDGVDLSVAELVRQLRRLMGRPPGLWHLPVGFFEPLAVLAGRRGAAERLFGTLQVSCEKARRELHWQPPFSVDDALRVTIDSCARAREEAREVVR